jgi:hypothetical protein
MVIVGNDRIGCDRPRYDMYSSMSRIRSRMKEQSRVE